MGAGAIISKTWSSVWESQAILGGCPIGISLQKIKVLTMKNSIVKTSKFIAKFFSDEFSDEYLFVTKKSIAKNLAMGILTFVAN